MRTLQVSRLQLYFDNCNFKTYNFFVQNEAENVIRYGEQYIETITEGLDKVDIVTNDEDEGTKRMMKTKKACMHQWVVLQKSLLSCIMRGSQFDTWLTMQVDILRPIIDDESAENHMSIHSLIYTVNEVLGADTDELLEEREEEDELLDAEDNEEENIN